MGKEPPVMISREEFKIELAREESKKLISQGWRRTEGVWIKKGARAANAKKVSNNI